MKSGNELFSALSVIPDYDNDVRSKSQAARLIALSDLYKFYIPSPMTTEIYSKLYLSLLHSLQKKATKTTVIQQNENHKRIRQQHTTVL